MHLHLLQTQQGLHLSMLAQVFATYCLERASTPQSATQRVVTVSELNTHPLVTLRN